MLTPEEISLIKSRRQALKVWLIKNDMTFKELADAVGIKSPTLDAHLNKLTMSEAHHKVLTSSVGGLKTPVPAHLLPEGADLRPGRKPALALSQMTACPLAPVRSRTSFFSLTAAQQHAQDEQSPLPKRKERKGKACADVQPEPGANMSFG